MPLPSNAYTAPEVGYLQSHYGAPIVGDDHVALAACATILFRNNPCQIPFEIQGPLDLTAVVGEGGQAGEDEA